MGLEIFNSLYFFPYKKLTKNALLVLGILILFIFQRKDGQNLKEYKCKLAKKENYGWHNINKTFWNITLDYKK